MPAVRQRVGIGKFDDGWNVVIELNGERLVFNPTYATEAEAEAKAVETARFLRDLWKRHGVPVSDNNPAAS